MYGNNFRKSMNGNNFRKSMNGDNFRKSMNSDNFRKSMNGDNLHSDSFYQQMNSFARGKHSPGAVYTGRHISGQIYPESSD